MNHEKPNADETARLDYICEMPDKDVYDAVKKEIESWPQWKIDTYNDNFAIYPGVEKVEKASYENSNIADIARRLRMHMPMHGETDPVEHQAAALIESMQAQIELYKGEIAKTAECVLNLDLKTSEIGNAGCPRGHYGLPGVTENGKQCDMPVAELSMIRAVANGLPKKIDWLYSQLAASQARERALTAFAIRAARDYMECDKMYIHMADLRQGTGYNAYRIDAERSGTKPLTFEQWMRGTQAGEVKCL